MGKTKIEWAEETWSPITGCTKISAGCTNCYAERMANRLANIPGSGYDKDNPFGVKFHPDRLDQPLKWKKPRKVFVCSMGDIFHEDMPFEWLWLVWQRMGSARRHTFMVLTKRAENMCVETSLRLPVLPNVWLGVTAENQDAADKRIPWLMKTPAAKRFVSVEPMLGPVDLDTINGAFGCVDVGDLDWVICGGETGPGARPMNPDWARSLRDQCVSADVPFFFKKHGEGNKSRLLDGREWSEWPEVDA